MEITIKFIAACALLTWANASFSSGSHADGHQHGSSAIGQPGVAAQVTRTVQIDMQDSMRFTPDAISVRKGETIRFVVKNSGQLKHEFNLGTEKDLRAHYEIMKKFPEMEHDEHHIASVAPGQTGEVIWKFTTAGTVNFGCLHPGHYEAGMKGRVRVGSK